MFREVTSVISSAARDCFILWLAHLRLSTTSVIGPIVARVGLGARISNRNTLCVVYIIGFWLTMKDNWKSISPKGTSVDEFDKIG